MHPDIDNKTIFSAELMPGVDEGGVRTATVVVKATLGISPDGRIVRAAQSEAVDLVGEVAGTDEAPYFLREPETAFFKPATDVVLIADARAPAPGQTHFDVGIRCGTVMQRARVFGERYWVRHGGEVRMTAPQVVERVPLTWEHAFGGWDRSDPDPSKHSYEPRNPAGRGFGNCLSADDERQRLPSIEHPDDAIRQYGQRVQPAGFGFIPPNWEPRSLFAGTYDENWEATRKPLLPVDFDRRHLNAAAPGLVVEGYLRGDEQVDIINASPLPRLRFHLPGFPPPACRLEIHGSERRDLAMALDTVMIDTVKMSLYLLWRGHVRLGHSRQRVVALRIETDHPAARRRAS